MFQSLAHRPRWIFGLGLSVGLLAGGGMLVGAWVALPARPAAPLAVPETFLHATCSNSSESFAMATGYIDEGVEGLFTLDFLTGDLTCAVLNPRSVTWVPVKINVINDLGEKQGKNASYVMVTGHTAFVGRAMEMASPAPCVVYVADATTGVVAAYVVAVNRTQIKTGGPGVLGIQRVGMLKGRAIAVRE
jgi:hypothetical protein